MTKPATVLLLSLLCLLFGGCFSSHPTIGASRADKQPTTVVAVEQAKATNLELGRGVNGVEKAVESLTAANVETVKPALLEQVRQLKAYIATLATQIEQISTQAIADAKREATKDKRIADLEKSDPVRGWLYFVGILCMIVGIGGLIASYFVPLLATAKVEPIFGAAAVFGIALITIAHFLTEIYWIAGLTGLGVGIAYAIYYATHRSIVSSLPQPWAGTQPTPASGGGV